MSRTPSPNLPPELRAAVEDGDEEASVSDLEGIWSVLDRAAPPASSIPDKEETWQAVRRHLEAPASSESERRASDRAPAPRRGSTPSKLRVGRRLWQWGSALALAVVVLVSVWWWTTPVTVSAPPGTSVTRTLPDGSTVKLNSETQISYPRTLAGIPFLESEERRVNLQGEAYFEVERGNRSFLVETRTARIEVVGTAFSVRSRANENHETQVALTEGELRVDSRGREDTGVSIRPGEVVRVGEKAGPTVVRDTSIDRIMAWRRGGFAVTARSLPEILRALERRFGTSLTLHRSVPEATRSNPLTLYYSDSARLEVILHDICMARNLTYRSTSDGFVLMQAQEPDTG